MKLDLNDLPGWALKEVASLLETDLHPAAKRAAILGILQNLKQWLGERGTTPALLAAKIVPDEELT